MSVLAFGPDNQLAVTGTIVALLKNGFQLESGKGIGYFNVYTSNSTAFTNFTPAPGEFVEADGIGSPATSMNGSSVKLLSLPSAPLTLSGEVNGMIVGGFTITSNNVQTSVFPIYSTTYSGTKPVVGESVDVSGVGAVGGSVVAEHVSEKNKQDPSPSPTPSADPSATPTVAPTAAPTVVPTEAPTVAPTQAPTIVPTIVPTLQPTQPPTPVPTQSPTPTPTVAPTPTAKPTPVPTVKPTAKPTPVPTVKPTAKPTPTPVPGATSPPATAFMPSSWGKISAFQVFDDTANGYIPMAAAAADGWRYSSVWGSRNNIGTSWLNSNPSLQTAYYNALETDESPTGWGGIGKTLSEWNSVHPDWVLYSCTSSGTPTTTPAWVPGLNNVPLDVHNPAVVAYQVRMMANYAHALGYHALAMDETTFWQADQGVSGGYGCGIYQNGTFVRRYTGPHDPNWANDVVQWVKIAHSMLTTDSQLAPYHLKLFVNHPAGTLSTNEMALLANVDADLDETGYINYGRPQTQTIASFTTRNNWATYAQQHGVAVMMNANWGKLSIGVPQIDYSVATYLMANRQAESLFAANAKGYGLEQWHSEYQTNLGAPCGAYYADSSSTGIFYRRFANAVVAVNAGSVSTQPVHLPTGHTYHDLFGRSVPSTIGPDDGYVLLTSNGCN